MKLYFFILALFLLSFTSCREGDGITVFGTIHDTDKILYSTKLQRPSKHRRGHITYDFNFKSFGSKDIIINAVKVVDIDKNTATVTLTNGGPGYKSVDLHFESKKGGGIFKSIEIYGQ